MFGFKRRHEIEQSYYKVFDLYIWGMDEERKNNFQKADKIKAIADKMHELQMSFLKEEV